MILAFELTMPRCNSWNGRWSGEDRRFIIVKVFSNKKALARAAKLIADAPYYYNWSDGWGARVDVCEVSSNESRKLRKLSAGFCGYDWMVRTIIDHGEILDDAQLKRRIETTEAAP